MHFLKLDLLSQLQIRRGVSCEPYPMLWRNRSISSKICNTTVANFKHVLNSFNGHFQLCTWLDKDFIVFLISARDFLHDGLLFKIQATEPRGWQDCKSGVLDTSQNWSELGQGRQGISPRCYISGAWDIKYKEVVIISPNLC